LPPVCLMTKGLILLNPADVTSHSSIVSQKIHADFPSKFFHDPVLPSLPGVLKACYLPHYSFLSYALKSKPLVPTSSNLVAATRVVVVSSEYFCSTNDTVAQFSNLHLTYESLLLYTHGCYSMDKSRNSQDHPLLGKCTRCTTNL